MSNITYGLQVVDTRGNESVDTCNSLDSPLMRIAVAFERQAVTDDDCDVCCLCPIPMEVTSILE